MFDPHRYSISYSPAALRERAVDASHELANVRARMQVAFQRLARPKLTVCPACGYDVREELELAA